MDKNEVNENELKVLEAAAQQIIECTSGQFGYLSDADIPEGMTVNQFKGFCGSLTKKKFIQVYEDPKYPQVMMTAKGVEILRKNKLLVGRSFEIDFDFVTV